MAFKRHKRTHMVVERTTHPRGRRRDQTVPVEERTCPVCGKICLHKDSLSRHLKTHDDPSTVKCPVCPRTFSNRTQLNQHKQTHTGELECPLCGKVFKWKHSLTEHIRAHDGVRPYKCEHCESDFTDNRALKKHCLAAHGVETKGGIRKDLGLEIVKTANRRKVIIWCLSQTTLRFKNVFYLFSLVWKSMHIFMLIGWCLLPFIRMLCLLFKKGSKQYDCRYGQVRRLWHTVPVRVLGVMGQNTNLKKRTHTIRK